MKKLLTLLLAAAMTLSMAACGSDATSSARRRLCRGYLLCNYRCFRRLCLRIRAGDC